MNKILENKTLIFLIVLMLFSKLEASNSLKTLKDNSKMKIKESFLQSNTKYIDASQFLYGSDKEIVDKFHEVKLSSCDEKTCTPGKAICLDSNTCVCNIGYLDIPQFRNKNNDYCTYELKKRSTAFLLELLIPFGFGHMYVGNYFLGVLKFCLYLIIPLIFLLLVNSKYNICSKFVVELFEFFWYVLIGLGFLIDVSFYATGVYRDANGIPLFY